MYAITLIMSVVESATIIWMERGLVTPNSSILVNELQKIRPSWYFGHR